MIVPEWFYLRLLDHFGLEWMLARVERIGEVLEGYTGNKVPVNFCAWFKFKHNGRSAIIPCLLVPDQPLLDPVSVQRPILFGLDSLRALGLFRANQSLDPLRRILDHPQDAPDGIWTTSEDFQQIAIAVNQTLHAHPYPSEDSNHTKKYQQRMECVARNPPKGCVFHAPSSVSPGKDEKSSPVGCSSSSFLNKVMSTKPEMPPPRTVEFPTVTTASMEAAWQHTCK